MHGAALVVGACAAAAAILGWFVMQRQKSARVALSIVAVPLFVAGLIAGGFLTSMVAVCAAVLWTKPSRDWFNGLEPPRREERRTPPARPQFPDPSSHDSAHRPVSPPSTGDSGASPSDQGSDENGQPRAFSGFGTSAATDQQSAPAPHTPDPYFSDPYAANPWAQGSPAGRRPTEVTRACVITWVLSGLIGLGWLLIAVWGAVDTSLVNDMFEQESRFQESGLSVNEVRAALVITSVLLTIWSLIAAGLAIFVHRGHDWARVLLIISAAGAGLISLLMVIAAPPMILVPVAAGYTIFALTRPASNEWFRARAQARGQARRGR
jgi:hypothetical protein